MTEPNGGAGNGEAGQGFLRKMMSAESEQAEFGRGEGIPSRGRNKSGGCGYSSWLRGEAANALPQVWLKN